MKQIKHKISNTNGFTLIETMIGLMILTIAIVAATSLLIGLIQSNKQIVKSLQAHYLAQEGLEAVRNIRDTNWMRNNNWLNGFSPLTNNPVSYYLGFNFDGMNSLGSNPNAVESEMSPMWEFEGDGKIYLCGGDQLGKQYFSTQCDGGVQGKETEFERHIWISEPEYCAEEGLEERLVNLCDEGKVILVKSVVTFGESEISLEEILTDWKGGAL